MPIYGLYYSTMVHLFTGIYVRKLSNQFKNLDVSLLFVDGILKEQNFKIDEAFINLQEEWKIIPTS